MKTLHSFVTGGQALPAIVVDDVLLAGMSGLLLLNLLILCYSSLQHRHHKLLNRETP